MCWSSAWATLMRQQRRPSFSHLEQIFSVVPPSLSTCRGAGVSGHVVVVYESIIFNILFKFFLIYWKLLNISSGTLERINILSEFLSWDPKSPYAR